MPTPQDIADAFEKAGVTTTEQVIQIVAGLNLGLQLRQIELAIDGLNAKRAEVLKPIDDERISLNNERNDLISKINAIGK